MSKHFKAIIPLLHRDLTMDDISNKRGFVGAFSYDINRPSLDTHIFLLFLYEIDNYFIARDQKLKASPAFRSRIIVRIKGYLLACYTFTSNKIPSVLSITSDQWNLSKEDKLNIFKFWNFTDDDMNDFMTCPENFLCFMDKFELVTIPEWDLEKHESTSFTVPLEE